MYSLIHYKTSLENLLIEKNNAKLQYIINPSHHNYTNIINIIKQIKFTQYKISKFL